MGLLPVSYYDASKSGTLVSRIMNDVEGVRNLIGTGLVEFAGGLLTAAIALIVLVRISPLMTGLAFGFLTWAAFGYIWVRTKAHEWGVAAVAYLALIVVSMVLLSHERGTWEVGVGTVGLIACWAGGFVHGLAWRGRALDLLSVDEDPRLRAARRRLAQRTEAADLAQANPSLAREAGIGRDADTFGGLVDVNGASAEELAQLPGFTVELGRRVVEVREKIDGFDNVDDFANILDLPPRLVDQIRDRLLCLPR